jgi:hypothetical protein
MTTKPPSPPQAPSPPEDPDAPPSEEEVAASDALRRALEDPSLPNEAADLARAASLAHAPRPIDPEAHRRIVETALARKAPRGGRVIRVSFAAGAALALAASFALVSSLKDEKAAPESAVASAPAVPAIPLVRSRSTQPLFEEPFAAPRGPGAPSSGSARIDRIAMARASDFRDNEYSRWGAR